MAIPKKIFIVMGGVSAQNASFGLSRELIKRGHTIFYIGPNWGRESIEKQGFAFIGFDTPQEYENKDPFSGKVNKFKRLMIIVRESVMFRDFIYSWAEGIIQKHSPDLALMDAKLFDFITPFLKHRIPLIQLNSNLSSSYSSGIAVPPVFSGLIPVSSPGFVRWISAFKIRLAWSKMIMQQKFFLSKLNFFFFLVFRKKEFKATQVLVKGYGGIVAHSEYGLRLLVPEIVLGPRLIDFPESHLNVSRYYAGICVDEGRYEDDFDFSALAKDKPIIYCSMGTNSKSYVHVKRFCDGLIAAMTALTNYELVLQTDNYDDIINNNTIPANVKVFKRVPQLQLLKLAVLHITHGGFSSVRESLLYGTSMLVFPGWHDQHGNAARIVYYGLGKRGDMEKVTTTELVSMIQEVLTDKNIPAALREMQGKLLDQSELNKSIEFIENYTGKS